MTCMNVNNKRQKHDEIKIFMIIGFLHLVVVLYGSNYNFAVVDEAGHIPAGISHWQMKGFSLYRVNPPLARMVSALPVLATRPTTTYQSFDSRPGRRKDFDVARDFAKANSSEYMHIVQLARLPGVLWSLGGAWLIYIWGKDLYGSYGGLIGATLWCFDPTVLAFTQVVTPDIPAAVAGLWATYAFRQFLRTRTWLDASLAGCSLGIAQLTKFTLILFYVIWPALLVLRLFDLRRRVIAWQIKQTNVLILQLLLIVTLSIYVINLGYFFEGSFRALGDFEFFSKTLSNSDTDEDYGNRFRNGWLAFCPVPLPAEYIQGIDAQKRDFESHLPSYLRGEWRNYGWYYYYIYSLFVKEPLGTLTLSLWSLVLVVFRKKTIVLFHEESFLIIPPFCILVFVSAQNGFNHHMRYILPSFPFFAILLGKLSCYLQAKTKPKIFLIIGLVGWSTFSSLAYIPHSMSYFNEIAGGPTKGHSHIINSNIDWGQDLLGLSSWLKQHPEARPLKMAYFNCLDPTYFLDIPFTLPPENLSTQQIEENVESNPYTGWFAISVNYLRGTTYVASDGQGGWHYISNRHSFDYFKFMIPVDRVGYSIYIYHITDDDLKILRRYLGSVR